MSTVIYVHNSYLSVLLKINMKDEETQSPVTNQLLSWEKIKKHVDYSTILTK